MPETPEQKARREIDAELAASGCLVQDKNTIDFNAGPGIAIREYQTDIGPADYVLFVDKKACGVIEAKKEDVAQNITTIEDQTADYANAKLKWVKNHEPLPFLFESTGIITRFTDARDPKPRSREVFSFQAQFSAIDALGSALDTNLQKAEALHQSILKKAFAGELVPQDPNDEPASALLARIRAERAAREQTSSGRARHSVRAAHTTAPLPEGDSKIAHGFNRL